MWGKYQQFLYGLLMGLLATGVLLVMARRPAGHPVQLLPLPTAVPLRIHVTGAVMNPGVYALPRGSIVQDAINAAGGPTERADLSQRNLAQLLVDGDQVIVPELPPTATPRPPTPTLAPTITVGPGTPTPTPQPTATEIPTSAAASDAPGRLVNINTATLEELDTLPGIGPAIGQRIIDYRTTNGPFETKEEIMNVRGIGPVIFEQIKDLITIE